jgi:predicted RNA binding protein YcfA (HicA-like mRNA interferase family)
VPRKLRELEADLKRSGFRRSPGKGSHRNYTHPRFPGVVTISGKEGDDAKPYQEKQVAAAIEKAQT